jgi:aryl-alcohol dehydrogenase-like predicted oxidoreductase
MRYTEVLSNAPQMRQHILGQTGVTSSHLGFGCVQLTAHKDRGEAVRMLEHAFASGITHFDVSRIYGFGRAEGILGEFLRGKRNKVTVATKFGIQPPSGLAGNRRVIDFAKKLLGPFPGLLRRARQRGSRLVQSGVFTPENAVQSLESSLRELGTDSVDIFLLHEATLADAANESLLETLRRQLERGTIRSIGIASGFRNLEMDASRMPSAYRVLQFEDNAENRNVNSLSPAQDRVLISHSVFRPLNPLRAAIAVQPAVTQKYSTRLSLNLGDPTVLGNLLLQFALHSNAGGVVLFSTADPNRVSSNVRGAESCPFDDQQMAGFLEFVATLLPSARIPVTS